MYSDKKINIITPSKDNSCTKNLLLTKKKYNRTKLKIAIDEFERIYDSLQLNKDDQLLDRAEKIDQILQEENRQRTYQQYKKQICKIINVKEPDLQKDDLFNRTIIDKQNLLKIEDPQPPFGIPLRPVTFSVGIDYLHSPKPYSNNRTDNCQKHNKYPDLVRDDLAYRSFRKEFDEVKKEEINIEYEYGNLFNQLLNCIQYITNKLMKSNQSYNLNLELDELTYKPNNLHNIKIINDVNNNIVKTTSTLNFS